MEQVSLTGFLKKNPHLGKWAILGPKIAHHNSGSAGRIFVKFCTMKENDINNLQKRNCLEQMDHFGPKNCASS